MVVRVGDLLGEDVRPLAGREAVARDRREERPGEAAHVESAPPSCSGRWSRTRSNLAACATTRRTPPPLRASDRSRRYAARVEGRSIRWRSSSQRPHTSVGCDVSRVSHLTCPDAGWVQRVEWVARFKVLRSFRDLDGPSAQCSSRWRSCGGGHRLGASLGSDGWDVDGIALLTSPGPVETFTPGTTSRTRSTCAARSAHVAGDAGRLARHLSLALGSKSPPSSARDDDRRSRSSRA